MKLFMALVVSLQIMTLPAMAQERAIDTQRSTITIHVGKAGLLSMAAHEHWVSAPVMPPV